MSNISFFLRNKPISPRLNFSTSAINNATPSTLKVSPTWNNIGILNYVGDGVAKAWGLLEVEAGELVSFVGLKKGMVVSLMNDEILIYLFDDERGIIRGGFVKKDNALIEMPVGVLLLGRITDGIGNLIDLKKQISKNNKKYSKKQQIKYDNVEIKGPGIITRLSVNEPLHTGWKAIDSLVPIGRGQRELIIGDRQTGKTTIGIDAILNQLDEHLLFKKMKNKKNKQRPLYCIYIGIGLKRSTVAFNAHLLKDWKSSFYSTFVCATASDAAALQFIAPYSGCTLGEWFRNIGQHALVIYDDLSKQANAYRQMSLLVRKPPGREAYPGDIFYLHSRLLERSAKLHHNWGGGSLTALPIIETLGGDVSAYIPTNVISITDGQIFLDADLFYQGIRPAINVGLSVSRIGSAAQLSYMKEATEGLKLILAQFREVEGFARFSKDLLDYSTQKLVLRGNALIGVLKQLHHSPMVVHKQTVILLAGMTGFFDTVDNSIFFEKFILLNKKIKEIFIQFKYDTKLIKNWKNNITLLFEKLLQTFFETKKI